MIFFNVIPIPPLDFLPYCLLFFIYQIEHLKNSSVLSYCVGQAYVTNEIIQFSERSCDVYSSNRGEKSAI